MECKFCFAEMDEDAKICPACGKSQEEENEQVTAEEVAEEATPETEEVEESEETEEVEDDEDYEDDEADEPAKKKKFGAWKVVLAVLGVLVTALILTGAILFGLGVLDETVDQIKATAQSLNPWRENDIYYKKSYTAEEKEVEKKKDIVVATMGEYSLTNAELQIYYHMCVDQYVDYLVMMGYDADTPFDEQVYDKTTGRTLQQLMLETAVQEWCKYTTLLDLSKQADFQLTEEQQGYLDSLKEQLETKATEEGYTDLELFFKDIMFAGSSIAAFDSYNYTGYVGTMYYYDVVLPSEADKETYFTENEDVLKENGITKDSGDYYNVRHIIITPKGGTENEDGDIVYSDAEWETCRATAQKLLDQFLAGEQTKDAFAELAYYNSEDSSYENGGLLDDNYKPLTKDTNFVEEFKAWYLDESRQAGDTGLVKTVYGYHVMYFEEKFPIWDYEVEELIVNERTEELTGVLEDAQAKTPMTVNYKKIVLGD